MPPDQKLLAIAFDTDGNQLATARVNEGENTLDLDLRPELLRKARVFVLPAPEDDTFIKKMSLAELEHLEAYQPMLRFNENGQLQFERLPGHLLDRWWWRRCCVRGQLTNRLPIDGIMQEFPVCNATVHLCRIERLPRFIQRIPLDLLDRFRWRLLDPIPVPLPDPFPFPRPEPMPRPLPEPPRPFNINTNARLLSANTGQENLSAISGLRHQLQHARREELPQIIAKDYLQLWPYFCHFPFLWPYLYRCIEIASVQTDSNSRFEACFWHQNWIDQPDIYIWAEYPTAGSMETIYRPSIPCYTYWNYACGAEINVQLQDDRIFPSCGKPLAGTGMAVRGIGHSSSPKHIAQNLSHTISVPGKTNWRTVGLSNFKTGSSDLPEQPSQLYQQHLRPYTGSFPILGQFGDALPNEPVSYFRWLYRKTHNETLSINPSASWKVLPIDGLSRNYTYPVLDGGTLDFRSGAYSLGPVEIDGGPVFKIPPFDPQQADVEGVTPSANPLARWNHYERVHIGQINSNRLDGDGLYEFRLQMLDQHGNPANLSPSFFRVPQQGVGGDTEAMPAAYLRTLVSGTVFQIRLRIDTATTHVAINEVSFPAHPESEMTDCGFMEYDSLADALQLSFEATHPQDFAIFSFNLERGRKQSTGSHFALGDTRGMVSGSAPPYTLTAGQYRGSFAVSNLLSGCGSQAAFAQVLNIQGLHTDGHQAGVFFRKTAINAFALTPA